LTRANVSLLCSLIVQEDNLAPAEAADKEASVSGLSEAEKLSGSWWSAKVRALPSQCCMQYTSPCACCIPILDGSSTIKFPKICHLSLRMHITVCIGSHRYKRICCFKSKACSIVQLTFQKAWGGVLGSSTVGSYFHTALVPRWCSAL